jgi:hypothetical protein
MDEEKLIDDHWKYVEGILKERATGEVLMREIEYHYKTAFRHGYKHGFEEGN